MSDASETGTLVAEIRGDLAAIRRDVAAVRAKTDKLDHDNETLRSQLNTIVELAGAATRRTREADAKATQALDWQENFDAEMERLEKKPPKN